MNTLREAVHDYLNLRRSLGFKLRETGKQLLAFVTFMEQSCASYITSQLALTWAQQSSTVQPADWAHRLSVVRTFARYRSATDPRTQLPPEACCPTAPSEHNRIYIRPRRSTTYWVLLFRYPPRRITALDLPLPVWLLTVTGMRLGEARNLELQDVDLSKGVLTIRGAKFGKSRLIPIHASTCSVLADYLARRNRRWATRPASSYLFVSNRGNQLDGGEIHRTFYALSHQIGLRSQSDSHGPRIHDLRHRFAVMTLLQWYRSGEDAERRLPFLSVYLVMSTSAIRFGT